LVLLILEIFQNDKIHFYYFLIKMHFYFYFYFYVNEKKKIY